MSELDVAGSDGCKATTESGRPTYTVEYILKLIDRLKNAEIRAENAEAKLRAYELADKKIFPQ